MKNILLLIGLIFCYGYVIAQNPNEQSPPDDDILLSVSKSKLYGKVIDKNAGKPIEAASVQVFAIENRDSLLTGMLSRPNGDFIFQGLSAAKGYRLVISALGYETSEQLIMIDEGNANRQFDKDLGNISLQTEVRQLGGVVVTASRPMLEMGIDRKIFTVDKNITSAGGTAIDVMKNIPSVSVDIDGNVQLRNSPPQIFVDGRPTILTLDQIPADNIDKIELITNPSAKFDAASSGGIINVVLKKNKRVGLNGIASVGTGTPGLFNSNLNLNLRQGKLNFFVSGGFNRSGGKGKARTLRENKQDGVATDYFNQYGVTSRQRRFTFLRFGADFFIDNRNTITLSQNFARGRFANEGNQDQEYLDVNKVLQYYGQRITDGQARFNNQGTRLNYKHNFPEEGKELTADLNYNYRTRRQASTIFNGYYFPDGSPYAAASNVWNNGETDEDQVTLQIDFADPIGANKKIETGLRSYYNKFNSYYNAFAMDNGQDVKLPLSNSYAYSEKINAAYFTFSDKREKFSYQLGLRAEYSKFDGELIDSAYKFGYEYPNKIDKIWDALFPSFFLSKKVGEKDELQFNYTRRIRRPRFWELNPFIDINDPVNLQQGNPQLRPEYVNSFELNYSKSYKNGNLLGVIYFRNNPRDITRYSDTITTAQYNELNNAGIDPNAILNTFINGNTTNRYGVELILQHKAGNNFDITPSFNLQYRTVNATVKDLDLSNKGFNWEAKLISNYKIRSKRQFFNDLSFQLSSEYESARVIPQGKNIPQYSTDFAIKKEFLQNKKATITFAVNDLFNTRRWGTIYDTDQFYQDSYQRWNVRNFRVTFSYKFGDANFSLLSRNGNRKDSGGEND